MLLSSDPITKIEAHVHADEVGGRVIFEERQVVDDIIEQNKAEFNATDEHARWGEQAQCARIPLSIAMDLAKDGRLYDAEYMKRWMNDRDNLAWRTRPGVI